ncbi:MAG: alanyl-tRNA synthetase [Candidatus Electronema aureum]|uniref:Alanine--tRNA ligase n=1 Tax=Candidatus Electronema aureum TaxID=2005002 RepID=A0A521G5C1_9BACT|nr:MAG: alanyl-tRNA synthetase [Candidatus Electronema aureum]
MTGNQLREKFLSYFASKGHTRVESSTLVPHDDPTLLFTNAGMFQFKRVFMGEEHRDYSRAVSCQRCVRAGGKHNDLENVGHTARHHTFFEMLGNFSFGDYFKKEAIAYAWEFLTKELGISPERLWVTIFRDDDEAQALWEEIEDLPKGRIVRLGEKDNFWAMGDTGPCGPCSEIHIDQGAEHGCGRAECALGCDCDRFLELWNLVFMQFYRDADGTLTKLPKPSIDTGMGVERVAAVLQGKFNNFDSEVFAPLISTVERLSGRKYHANRADDAAMRVIADHARATAFLVADGVLPSNEGRGYVLRRVMRRAIRFGRTLGLNIFFGEVCREVVQTMGAAYPHLHDAVQLLNKVTEHEESRFGETLDKGLAMLDAEIARLLEEQPGSQLISGDFIFKLYDTYGFPKDIVRDAALEQGLGIDDAGFEEAMQQQREQSRRSWKGKDFDHFSAGVISLLEQGKKSEFLGYQQRIAESVAEAILDNQGSLISRATVGAQVQVFCPQTPFYAESGGQVGDTGTMTWPGGSLTVHAVKAAAEGLVLHSGTISTGTLTAGQQVSLQVDDRRTATALNHTATHLLHAAMKQLLGSHVKQAGSLVRADRLRFDFTHFSPVTPEEIRAIEQLVNQEIRRNTPVQTAVLAKEAAIAEGATALFGEKYGDEVRVVSIPGFSKELCGGTHTAATGDIGLFKILSETGIAAGVRRIEAVTGQAAIDWLHKLAAQADELGKMLSGSFEDALHKVPVLLKRQKELEKEISALSTAAAASDLDSLLAGAVEIDGIKVISGLLKLDSPKTLRDVGDKVRDKMGSGAALLGGEFDGKAALLVLVSKDLTGRIKAGDIVSAAAAIVGGKGGGRPDMAQAGGPMADKLPEAMRAVPGIVARLLEAGR